MAKRDDLNTATKLGYNIAAKFSEFVKASPKFTKQIPFIFRNEIPEGGALNKHLVDSDTTAILKRLFGAHTKEELLADSEWMKAFYGTEAVAKKVLGNMSQEEWDNL